MLSCLEWYRTHVGADDPVTARMALQCACHLALHGQSARAVELFAEGFRAAALQSTAIPLRTQIFYRGYYARAPERTGRHAEAALRELVALVEKARPQDLQRWGDLDDLGGVLIRQQKSAEAIPILESVIARLEQPDAADDSVTRLHLPQAKQRLAEAQQGR